MGHRKKHAPKRGSLAFLPRGRAARPIGRIRYWPEVKEGPRLLGFMGYKAGMTHVFVIDNEPRSSTYGKEIVCPATILDVPPILVCAIRAYTRDVYGLKAFTEAWIDNPPKDVERVFTLPEKFETEKNLKKIEGNLDKIAEFRVIAITQPKLASGVPKKKPDVMEIKIGGGTIQEQFEYAKNLLGKTVTAEEVFKEGQYVDVIAITKGKGFQGPVKRWGIKILPRKSRKTKRGVAAIGPWKPARVMYSVPRAGQMGYHQRTEYNKKILKIGKDGTEITPKGGFIHYGVVKGPYILLEGSIPGPKKRLVRLRLPARPPKEVGEAAPIQITGISLKSQQGK
jgi:large subunit ribosomal protein L3